MQIITTCYNRSGIRLLSLDLIPAKEIARIVGSEGDDEVRVLGGEA